MMINDIYPLAFEFFSQVLKGPNPNLFETAFHGLFSPRQF